MTGLGDTAHIYDTFAPKLTSTYRVCGITRRGFGMSSAPPPHGGSYSADRLGDDVLAVIDALDLSRPVLIGHSIAGGEASARTAEGTGGDTCLIALRASMTMPPAAAAVMAGQQKYTSIPSPALALFAVPHSLPPALSGDAQEKAAFEARDRVTAEAHARAFEVNAPHARVVRLPQASHYVFLSHEADVLREISDFIETLPA